MAEKTLTRVLGDFAHDLSFQALPAQIVEKAEISIIDGIGCSVAGAGLPSSKIALDRWEQTRRDGPCTVWATGAASDSESASWANCLLMHGILHDDMQEATVGHMGSLVIPAALALAEEEGKSGKDLVTAVAAGYEVAGRIAKASAPSVIKRGFRASPVFGPFAAAVAAGKLMGLTADQMQNAIACAASFSCGLLEAVNGGSMEWRFQNGAALRNGLMAASLARGGLRAAATALEGSCGFFEAFAGPAVRGQILEAPEEITGGLGRDFEVGRNIFKPYPTCGYNQVGVDVALALARRHDVKPEEVESVRALVSPENKDYPGGDFHGPFTTIEQALLSKPFSLAAAIQFRDLTVDMYSSELASPAVASLAGKVTTEQRKGMGFLDYEIEIRLKSGEVIRGDHTLADMGAYSLDRERCREKFRTLTAGRFEVSHALAVADALLSVHEARDVKGLSALLQKRH